MTVEQRPRSPKSTNTQSFEILDSEAAISYPVNSRPSFLSRWSSRLEAHPRLHKAWLYLRGPRPKTRLPDPSPLLDIDRTLRGKRIVLPIESTFLRKTRFFTNPWLFWVLVAAYIIGLSFLTRQQWYLIPSESFITCTATYWLSNSGCGLNGEACAPFDNSTFDFRCPAQCSDVPLANPRAVGLEEPVYVPLIVGGGDQNHTYRGDSFICAAAVQSGMISNSKGGCASLELTGNFTDFIGYTSNGLASVSFPTIFPLSYRFSPQTSLSQCEDLRDPALAYDVLITCLLFFLLRPKPIVLFWCVLAIGFWHITLWSQPRSAPPSITTAFGDFLPTLCVGYVFWRVAFRFTFPAFRKAPIESTILFLGPYWVGVLFNLTFAKLPVDRLLASDLRRPGAIPALLVMVLVAFVAILNQARVICKTGWFFTYLGWYIAGALVVLVISLLPTMQFRLHHYAIGMILMPLTGFPTRLSLFYQGLLLGFFLNGIAAFSYDSIFQTVEELRRDAIIGSAIPSFLTNSTNWNTSIPFQDQIISWLDIPTDEWDGFSLLVDDVERYTGADTNFSLAPFRSDIPHFFRLGYTSGGQNGDYTKAAVLWPNGTWQDPAEGAT